MLFQLFKPELRLGQKVDQPNQLKTGFLNRTVKKKNNQPETVDPQFLTFIILVGKFEDGGQIKTTV